MIALLSLIGAAAVVIAAAYLPGLAIARVLGASRLLALALAPALGAAVAGLSAMIAPLVGLRWSLFPFLLGTVLLLGLALALRRLGVRLPATVLSGPTAPGRAVPARGAWLAGAVLVAVVPLAVAAGRPDAILERWDTLYHLSALQRIRETGVASSLAVGSVSNSAGDPTPYPAGFHALASLVPAVEVPILLNGAVAVLATVPWILGTALLARTLFPEIGWAPFAAALGAALIPACPLNLWIHLSPIPNLTGFAVLPGALGGAAALWGALVPTVRGGAESTAERAGTAIGRPSHPALASVMVIGVAGAGLGLLHPNAAVTALVLLAVLTAATAISSRRTRPLLILVPMMCIAPVLALTYTPLGAHVTSFSGGLQVSGWTALGEVGLGLLTVWPMALGAVMALLWWPGLVTSLRAAPQRWIAVAWIVIAVLYLDAAVDSPLNLTALYYRGQDRLSMPLAMLSVLLLVPGLQAWSRALGRRPGARTTIPAARSVTTVLVALAVVAALTSVPPRLDNAARNLAPDHPGRGRFLQADERALFERYGPLMDHDSTLLASPYSGAAHLYAMFGQDVRLPVLGMAYSDLDRELLYAVELADTDPEACALLRSHGIGYVYQELEPYQYHKTSAAVNLGSDGLGRVLFATDHSRMIEIECEGGDGNGG